MTEEIRNLKDFRHWVRVECAKQETSQYKIACQLNVAYPRISEAVNGKPDGVRYRAPLILALGGQLEDFKHILGNEKGS